MYDIQSRPGVAGSQEFAKRNKKRIKGTEETLQAGPEAKNKILESINQTAILQQQQKDLDDDSLG